MRLATICVALAALMTLAISPRQAQAFDFDRGTGDPYFYYPSERGYYPYYNSGQWRTARDMRYLKRMSRRHFSYPQYNPVWGHSLDGYRNREWHRRHHGRHHIGHW